MPRVIAAMLSLLVLAGLLAVLYVLTWRSWRQAILNRELVIAITTNDLRRTEKLLSEGGGRECALSARRPEPVATSRDYNTATRRLLPHETPLDDSDIPKSLYRLCGDSCKMAPVRVISTRTVVPCS